MYTEREVERALRGSMQIWPALCRTGISRPAAFEALIWQVWEGSKMDKDEFKRSPSPCSEMLGWDRSREVSAEGRLYELAG